MAISALCWVARKGTSRPCQLISEPGSDKALSGGLALWGPAGSMEVFASEAITWQDINSTRSTTTRGVKQLQLFVLCAPFGLEYWQFNFIHLSFWVLLDRRWQRWAKDGNRGTKELFLQWYSALQFIVASICPHILHEGAIKLLEARSTDRLLATEEMAVTW